MTELGEQLGEDVVIMLAADVVQQIEDGAPDEGKDDRGDHALKPLSTMILR